MNKIYKLVWSAALGQFVVTSEVANSRGKSGGRQGGATATVLQSWLVDKPLTLLYSATLVAVMAYSSPADADVLFNSSVIGSGDTICTNINDTTGATKFIGEWISVRCAQYRTSATNDANFYKTLVTGRSALALGGELFVNGGKIGLADYEGGTYGMRIGSVATVDAAIGLDAIAIGTAQTTANDGATSTPTTASAARTIAIGSATSSTAADALALGTTATASATNAIAIGTQSRADAAEAVAIGTNAVATGGRAVSIGSGNVANGNGAVAIGDPNTATGSGAIAQGLDNTATGNGAVAMGNTNMVGGGGQAVGVAGTAAQGAVGIGYQNTVAGQGAVGIGDRNTVSGSSAVALGRQSNATGLSAIALGLTASATNTYAVAIGGLAAATGENAVAVGQGANATMLDSLALGSNAVAGANAGDVALGANSSTTAVVATTGAIIDGVAYTYAGTAPQSTVSVGQPGFERTITNVAAGRVDATSTDAINGSQLLATNLAVDTLGMDLDALGDSTASSLGGTSAYNPATHTVTAGLAVGGTTYTNVQDALTQLDTVATAGWNVSAQGTNLTNVAPDETVDLNNSDGNIVVSKTTTDDDVTFDLADDITVTSVTAGGTVLDASGLTIAGGPSVTTVGIDAGNTVITNVAPGTVSSTSTDAVNGSQLFAVSEVANAGWNISDGTSSGNIAPDETLTVTAGSNAEVTYDDATSTLTVGVVADPSFNSITVGDTVINDGSISFTSGGPSISNGGIDAGGTVITNVAPGVAGTDAVNVDQLTAVSDIANAGWNISAQGANATNVAPGEAVDLNNSDGNIVVSKTTTDDNVTFDLADDITVTSVTAGGTVLNSSGLTIAGGPSVTTVGIDAGGTVITNVAPGVAGTDAVNVDQLTALGDTGVTFTGNDNTAGDVQRALGSTLSIQGDATTAGTYSGGNLQTVTDPATGTIHLQMADSPVFGATTINAGGTGIISGVTAGVAGTDAVNVDQLTAVSDVANAGWDISAQGANATNVAPGEAVDLNNSDGNIVVSKTTTDDNVTFDLADDITVTSVTAGGTVLNSSGLTIAGGPSVTTSGIDAGNTVITNVAPGTVSSTSTDAVNGSQLFAVSEVANAGWNISDGTSSGNIAPDETLTVTAGSNAEVTYDDATSTLTVGVVADPSFNSITVGDTVINDGSISFTSGGPSLTSTGIDAGGTVITNVAPGVAGTDAVNVDQLTALGDTGLTFTGNDNTAGDVQRALGSTLSIQGDATTAGTYSGGNLQTVTDPATGTIHLQMADSPVFGATTINAGGTGIISGVTAGVAGTDAVNVDQLTALGSSTAASLGGTSAYDPATQTVTAGLDVDGTTYTTVQDALTQVNSTANAGWNISDGTSSGNIAPDETLTVTAGSNAEVTYDDATSTLTVGVVADPSFNSITVGDTVINDGSISFTSGGPSISNGGIDAGGTVITNVAPGVAGTDAVNVDQLTAVSDVANAGWDISAQGANATNVAPGEAVDLNNSDGNIVVSKTTTGDNVTFDLADDITVTSVTAGGTVLNSSGLTIAGGPSVTTVGIDAGGTVITNVAPGVAGTDAVNVDQLTALGDTGLTFTGNDNTAGDVQRALGSTLSIQGDATTAGTYSGGNLQTVTDPATGTIHLQMADSPVFGATTINAGGTGIISGVTAGVAGTDAVNVDQLTAVSDIANAGWDISAQGANATNVAPGEAVDLNNSDGNIVVSKTTTDDNVTFDLADDITVASVTAGGSVLNSSGLTIAGGPSVTTSGIDAGNTVITNVAPGTVSSTSTDAVNGSQLFAVSEVANAGWNISDGTSSGNIAPDETLTVTAGSNAEVTYDDATSTLTVGVVADPSFNSITVGDTVINDGSISFTSGGPSLTSTGIDAGGTGIISGVTAGVAGTDAVNVDQLTAVSDVANAGWDISAQGANATNVAPGEAVDLNNSDGNIVVSKTTTDDNVTFDLADDITVTSVTAGGSVLNSSGLTIAGGPSVTTVGIDAGNTVITNVAPGVAGTDAANVDQVTNLVDGARTHYYSVNDNGVVGGNYDNDGATGINALAAGVDTSAAGDAALALGYGAAGGGLNAIAIGTDALASNTGSIAIGQDTVSSGLDTIAIGTGASATNSVALGARASAGAGGTALGDGANATLAGGVALGKNSVEGAANATASTTIAGTTYTFAGTTPTSVVSVGSVGAERQITNVAAGQLSATSTDAVNGSQLFATHQAIEDVAAGLTHYYSVNDNGVAGGNYDNDGATGINALAAGVGASAAADSATAIGEGAVAGAQAGDVALGSGSTTAAVVATASGSVDGVTYTYAGTAPTSTVSVGSVGAERTITHVAAGQVSSTSTDAVNGSQLFATNQAVGSLGVNLDQVGASTAATLGGTSVYDPVTHTVTGGLSVGGSTYTTVQDALTQVNTTASAGWNITDGTSSGNIGAGETLAVAAGSNAAVTYDDATGTLTVGVVPDPSFTSVAIGNTSITTDGLTIIGGPGITIAGIDAGGTTITNVAAGVNGTDAVNVDQLNQVVEGASAHYYSVNDGGVNGGNYANDGATATGAIASGVGASATATDAVAIGTGATSGDANSVALGAGSATSAAVGTTGTTIAGTDYTFAGGVPVGTVSVGDAGAERTITHVAAGRLSATSTDAVNGSQLYATNQAIDALDGRVTTVEGDVANLTETVGGFDSRITNVEGDVADLTETVNTFDGRITNVQNGADGMFQVSQEDAITKPAPTGTNAAAGGNGAVASGDNALAVGNQSTASGNDSTALGNGATASHGNSVALGAGSATTVGAQSNYNAAYVGDSTSTGEVNIGGRTISGVAAGTAGTDAVNVSQLNGGVNYAINQANAYTDNRLSGFYSDMWTMRREARGGTASAMAMAGLPQAYLPGKSMLAVAAGGYQGEYGMAVGLSGVTENGRWVYKAQASGNTTRDWGFTVGAGIQW
ncbi:YadA-like family protein [Pseudoxanthomonas sp. F37]|uniref:YadA-like family protein n=1 Tax=Pseudoxanthomonas sp. F37 TaxID=2932492 RepID=UPI001FCFCD04|nr:YadA-like family protein [Pseudoxanthomonas sp. F37]UOV09228.1 YadA-like family protein [Pseudoxanthomonas sp. F37]